MKVIALYDYQGTEENHLTFRAGDILEVYQQEDGGWWSGAFGDQIGWFPSAYVQEHQNEQSLWESYETEDHQIYYVHKITGESSWTLPIQTSLPVLLEEREFDASTPIQTPPLSPIPEPVISTQPALKLKSLEEPQSSPKVFEEPPSPLPSPMKKRISNVSTAESVSKYSMLSIKAALTDPNAQPMPDENGNYQYQNNFWSDKGDKSGFDILVLKHRNGKEVCKDISQFMLERARIEEQYAKQLMDLAKSQLGDMEQGTTKTAWNQVKFDIETQAKSRLDFVQKITSQVQQPIMQFKNEQKRTRKNYEATIALDRKILLAKYANVLKMQKVYLLRAKEAAVADALVARGQTATMTKKDFMKIDENARRERKKASIAALDYKNAVSEYEEVRLRWEEDMQSACTEFQAAEEQRIEYLKEVLKNYLTVQKEANEKCKESSEMVENSIISVSKEVDIEMFIKSNFTGNQRPHPLKFEQFKNYS